MVPKGAFALKTKKGFTLIELMIVIAIIAIIAAIAIPNLIQARKNANESAAVGALKTIGSAQSLFREGDKDGDGDLDYGNLQQLGNAIGGALVDPVLAGGVKSGYNFACNAGTNNTTQAHLYTWWGSANPTVPTTTGDRYFWTNHTGVIYFTTQAAFAAGGTSDATCDLANRGAAVGK